VSVRRFLLCLPATLLALIIAAPAGAQEGPTFVDTVGTSHEVAVERLVAEGLVQGCTEDRFCSTDDLTRGQMASILSRALGLGDTDAGEDGNDDVTIAAVDAEVGRSFVDIQDSVHAGAVELLASEGLVNGCEEGRFCPNDTLTRGQLASMLVAAFDLEPASGEESYFIDGSEAHGASIETLGANGISSGCGPVTFCTNDSVLRSHGALFLTRTLGLTERVTFAPFEERLAEHEELERQRIEQERIEAEQRREREEREKLETPGQVAVQTALAQLGKPYRWGGSGPGSFDCSGLVVYSYRAAGVTDLPHSSGALYGATARISRSELRPGDLVFYHSPISHVAIYMGDGKVVEAPNSGNDVRIRNDGLTRSGIVGYGRVR